MLILEDKDRKNDKKQEQSISSGNEKGMIAHTHTHTLSPGGPLWGREHCQWQL